MTAQEWTLEPWEYLLARTLANQVTLRTLAAATLMRGSFDDDQPGRYVSDQLTVIMRESFSERLHELAISGGATDRDCLEGETLEEANARGAVRTLAFAEGILAEALELARDRQGDAVLGGPYPEERKPNAVEHENRDAIDEDGVSEEETNTEGD